MRSRLAWSTCLLLPRARTWPYPLQPMSRSRAAALVLVVTAFVTVAASAAGPRDGKTYSYLQVFREVLGLTKQNYVEPTEDAVLLEGAFRGMVSSLDVASTYLAPGEEKELQTLPGPGRTGMEVLPSGGVAVVVRIDPGSPADKAGLRVGDQIWRIGEKPARQLAWPQLRHRLSGAIGTPLKLTILNGDNFKLEDKTITLAARTGKGFSLENKSEGLVYLRVMDLEQLDAAALRRDLASMATEHAQVPWLVDLRGVVGLDPQILVPLAGVLYDGGSLLTLNPRQGETQKIEAPVTTRAGLPSLSVLIDGSTAGTGEALAILLKEKTGATLYGRQSFGLGSTPELIPLSSGGSLLLTTREMKTATGFSWAGKGIDPDKIVTPGNARIDDDAVGGDPLLDETIRLLRSSVAAVAVKPAA